MTGRWRTIGKRQRAARVMLLMLVVGCDLPGRPDPADRPILPGEVMSFDELYSVQCAGCHGADGAYGPAPPLNDSLFVKIIPEDVLKKVIRNGRPGTPMPPFLEEHGGALNEKQIEVVVAGIRSKWGTDDSGVDPLPAYESTQPATGELSADQLQRCEQLFARACAGCHGANGEGGQGDVVTAGGAINVRSFLALISDQAIRRIIITGRSDLGMPDFAATMGRSADFKPLSSAEIDELVSLLAHWRKNGPGSDGHETTLSRLEAQ